MKAVVEKKILFGVRLRKAPKWMKLLLKELSKGIGQEGYILLEGFLGDQQGGTRCPYNLHKKLGAMILEIAVAHQEQRPVARVGKNSFFVEP